jgi:hypothetical protein
MPVVFLDPSLNGTPALTNVDLTTFAENAVDLNELYFWTLSIVWCLKKIEE